MLFDFSPIASSLITLQMKALTSLQMNVLLSEYVHMCVTLVKITEGISQILFMSDSACQLEQYDKNFIGCCVISSAQDGTLSQAGMRLSA